MLFHFTTEGKGKGPRTVRGPVSSRRETLFPAGCDPTHCQQLFTSQGPRIKTQEQSQCWPRSRKWVQSLLGILSQPHPLLAPSSTKIMGVNLGVAGAYQRNFARILPLSQLSSHLDASQLPHTSQRLALHPLPSCLFCSDSGLKGWEIQLVSE